MTDPERDDEFEAFLRRRSVLPRREAVTEKLEPPDNLDVIVLRKARQAIQASPQLPLYKAPRWALPVALAATILLCLSIVLNVSLNTGRRADSAREDAAGVPRLPASAAKSAPSEAMQEIAVTAARRSAPAANAAPSAVAALPSTAAQSMSAPADIAPPPPAPSPEAWLKRIDRLRAAGKTAQADAEMRRFQAAFPTYPVKPAAPSPSEPPK
jgi:hypothetical protein